MAQFKSVRPTCNTCQVQMWLSRVRPAPTNPLTFDLYTFECAVCGATEAMTLDRSINIEAIDPAEVQERRDAGIDAARAAAYTIGRHGRGSQRLARSTQGLERPVTLVSILGLMRLTAEIRWFWPGRPPQEFHAWFVGAGPAWGRPARAKHVSTSTFAIRTKIPLASRSVAAATSRSRADQPLNLLVAHRQSTLGQVDIAHAEWPAEKQRCMRSFSVHADSVSGLATSSEPVSGGVLSGMIALKRIVATMRGTGAPVAMQAPNRAAQTKRRVVWPLKKLGYARVISP
jgi:hypothetical protein